MTLKPRIKISLILPLAFAFASLIALGGHPKAATEPSKGLQKKHTAAPVKRDAAKRAPAKKAAAQKGHSGSRKTASASSPNKKIPLPRPRPDAAGATPPVVLASATSEPVLPRPSVAAPVTTTTSPEDLSAVKTALGLIQKGRIGEAHEVKKTITDPAAQKLIEWAYLRSSRSEAGFERYAAFVRANPSWPSVGMLQRRAEGALLDDKRDPAAIRAFFAENQPKSGKGRLALARALLAQGDQAGARHYVREAWRRDTLTVDAEQQALEAFREFLTPADHRARMHRLLFAQENDAAMRAARRLGDGDVAVAKARIALNDKSEKAGTLLDAVPAEARGDPNYVLGRAQWLRRTDKIAEAGQLLLAVPRDASLQNDLDEWWVERRLLARKLLDIGDAQTAYRIARDAIPPEKENSRVEHEFTAGWIALRFLNDPSTGLAHFNRIPESTIHPTSLARAYYWQGRALEALGKHHEARAQYQAAARFSTAYYGQIARARLGLPDMPLRRPPELSAAERAALRNVDLVRAVEILYAIGERDLVVTMAADLGDRPANVNVLTMIGDIAAQNRDARAMLYLGKSALGRGHPFEIYAFPDVGVPSYAAIAPEIDRSIVYAITRQESAFNPKIVSSANAQGLMQVTPEAGRDTAKRFGAKYDGKRLLHDSVYNVQMGAAELAGLIQDYRGSYVLTFAGYNAGRGRIRDWIARYGDPRDPKVDPIDWVERIPFAETRNYVQRVMENLQVYRVRLGGPSKLMIEADLRRGASAN